MLLWWSTLRIVNLSWLRLPLFFSLSDCNNKVGGVIKFKLSTSFSSSPEPEEVSCCSLLDEKDSDDFLPWLERKAGVQISSVLSIGKSAYGRSLLASKSIQTGDCMLRVPDSVQIAPDNLLSEINVLVPDEAANVAKLAMVVIVEQKMGQHSEWAPYISSLPRPGEMHNTIFWSEKEMEMIRQSSVYEETITKNAHIEKDFLVVKPVFDHFPETFGITFDVFQHAYALVESRAWRSTRGVSLIPFADFLNHDGAAEADVIYVDDEGKERSEVIADRNYAPGEQVLIRYGKFSNATLLLDYGFTLPYNIYDEVQIRFNIPQHDPLCTKKLELLHGYRTPTIEDVSGVSSSQDSFTLKEVRSAKGKGRGIPQSLRAFARVLCCSSSQELRDLAGEAAQNDGRLARRPLKNESREIEAHQFLLSRINLLIEEHIMSIQSLDSLTCPVMFGELALRRRMARDLLSESIQVTPEKGANCEGLIMDRRSRSPKRSKDSSPPPLEGRKHSPTPDERSPRERGSPSPRDRAQGNGSEYSGSPKARSRSPMDDDSGRESPQRDSPVEENGRSRSPSPIARNRRSSPDDDEDK